MAQVDKLCTRLYKKCQSLSTWYRKLNNNRFDARAADNKARGWYHVSFFSAHVAKITKLMTWTKKLKKGERFDDAEINWLKLAMENDDYPEAHKLKAIAKTVERVRTAWYFAEAHGSKLAKSYIAHSDFKFQNAWKHLLTCSLLFPDLSRGIHWTLRMRTGSFITFKMALDAELLVESTTLRADGRVRDCACCEAEDADSKTHFLLRCTNNKIKKARRNICGPRAGKKRLGLHELAEMLLKLTSSPRAILTTALKDSLKAFSKGEPRDVELSILLLGGKVDQRCLKDVTPKVLAACSPLATALDQVCKDLGLNNWRATKNFGGSHAGFLFVAAFLCGAVPERNSAFWGRCFKPSTRQRQKDKAS